MTRDHRVELMISDPVIERLREEDKEERRRPLNDERLSHQLALHGVPPELEGVALNAPEDDGEQLS
ncbi:hypothetical protein [Sorangium sp. So ce1000]|uniref:hypothetical protein n=1 Tax=Sorangium sp. So ce1000 TaxID=3133325 RepID=UPI003F5E052E